MTKIYNFEEFNVNESELNEGLFSSIKRRKALNRLASHSQELYDAIVKKYDIDVEHRAFTATKEFHELSRAAQEKKAEAFDQRKRAAEELVSELREKCQNDISSRSDDEKFIKKAKELLADAESRARKEVMRKAEQEISSRSLKDLRSEFDDELEDYGWHSYFRRYKPSNYEKIKENERAKMRAWLDKHKGWLHVSKEYAKKEYDEVLWDEPDKSKDKISDDYDRLVIAPDGEYYGYPSDTLKDRTSQAWRTYMHYEEEYKNNK